MHVSAPRPILALIACLATAIAGSGRAQTTTDVLIDFGVAGLPTNGTVAESWNDVEPGVQGSPFELRDVNNQPTGIQFAFVSGATFAGANSAGTTTPQPGSPLAQFPPAATSDVMYGSGGSVRITFSGMDPNALHDFTFGASRLGVNDVRTADYTVQGFNGGLATLDAANNISATATVAGIKPDASGSIQLTIRAAASNTNSGTHYFYLGELAIKATDTGSPPVVLGFSPAALTVSRPAGKPPIATPVTLHESTGAPTPVALTAVDSSTGLAPTWLTMPANTVAGAPFNIQFDSSTLALGNYAATVTAQASGYATTVLHAHLTVRDPAALNLLFYGNSYSIFNGTVPTMVRYLAEEAGRATPTVVARLSGGKNLLFHRTDPGQVAAISNSLPLGEEWDVVVMQGHSLDATRLANPIEFRQHAVGITQNVRNHSPAARAVLYQTWARGPGHSVYSGTYSEPFEMHTEIQTNYELARGDIDAAFGTGTARRAAAGQAVALLGFDPSLYAPDLSHPSPSTTLLASMAIFEALYDVRVCDLDPDFNGSSNLVLHLNGLGLTASDWRNLRGIGERVAVRSVRRYPGSDEDLLLRSGTQTPVTACPLGSTITPASWLLALTSPNRVYNSVPAVFLLSAFTTGTPPAGAFPELHVDPSATFVLAAQPNLANGIDLTITVPPVISGFSVLIQGAVLAPSRQRGNPLFVATDGHELQFR